MSKKETIRFAVYGIGPIGSLIAKYGLERSWMELVGAFDIDPLKVGRDVGEIIGLNEKTGIVVEKPDLDSLNATEPDIVFHATGSFLDKVYKQILDVVKTGSDVISTCETLSYPYYRYPELANKLEEEAKKNDSTILGTGINPGFLLDLLPAIMTTPCIKFEKITARRIIEASKRRESFRKKIGLGLDPVMFNEKIKNGELTAHVGYAESVFLLADALNLKLDTVYEKQEPIIAEREVKIDEIVIRPGRVRGIRGYGAGFKDNKEIIRVEFIALAGVDEEFEEITIEGAPRITWKSIGGTPGDIATVAVVLNYAPIVLEADPGLIIVTRLRAPSYKNIHS
jgi:4-hydroxy-tetrahydrodipicolinate reductase